MGATMKSEAHFLNVLYTKMEIEHKSYVWATYVKFNSLVVTFLRSENNFI